ncbi:HAMP domain-containing protein, partial [Paenibacillus darwinianus]
MNSFRSRLAVIMIVLTGLSVSAAGLFMAQSFERKYISALQENMVREIKLIIDSVEWRDGNAGLAADYYTERAAHFKEVTGARVTFIDGDGDVLGDSDFDQSQMANQVKRPEVNAAKRNGVGRDIRESETVKQNWLYVAYALRPGAPDSKIVRLSMNIYDVERSIRELWVVLLSGLLLLFIFAAAISYRVALGLTHPLELITRVAKRIKNMDYQARVPVTKNDEIGELGVAINAMAESLQDQMQRIRQKEGQLESVLDNMINGIVMIDKSGRILLLNRMAEEVLGFSAR